ncbi:hypothetical protein EVG20_g6062 [Dentipellis fragilis]|uniref:Uncharacterized protein n=1 Tax=Dentipellis fragilis TaxID=205917 RepID=A0A4Y9YNQ8_9AGAM|nr:hypothetical protein EVG20_g6062 [Dentipellis fragilis]
MWCALISFSALVPIPASPLAFWLGTLVALAAKAGEPAGIAADDGWGHNDSLDVDDGGGRIPKRPPVGGEGWFQTRLALLTLKRLDERSLFAGNIGTGAALDVDIENAAAASILSEDARLAGLVVLALFSIDDKVARSFIKLLPLFHPSLLSPHLHLVMDAQPIVSLSKRHERSSSDQVSQTQASTKPAAKRFRGDEHPSPARGDGILVPEDDDAMPAALAPALKIKRVMDEVWRLPIIGHCRTKIIEAKLEKSSYSGYELEEEVYHQVQQDMTENEHLVKELGKIYEEGSSVTSGILDNAFRLKITYPGCEVEKDITASEDQNSDMLQQLFDHSAVAGYGDVQTQETKIDESKRSESIGATTLPPNRVRVEPYKIHIYGPGGHFKAHRDTPANGLVGTFLVGLGDTTSGDHLEVASSRFRASAGHWVAFYPDTSHRISEIRRNYRAVIAFKIFRENIGEDEIEDRNGPLVARIAACVRKMKAPFGLFLEHKYCMGTRELSGTDAALYTSLQRQDGVHVHLLPIVIESGATWSQYDEDDEEDEFWAKVHPFTNPYVEYASALAGGRSEDKTRAKQALNDPSLSWVQGMDKKTPFYYADFEATMITWSSEEQETVNHVGNEAEAWREDSIYLSYAVVVLPVKSNDTDSIRTVLHNLNVPGFARDVSYTFRIIDRKISADLTWRLQRASSIINYASFVAKLQKEHAPRLIQVSKDNDIRAKVLQDYETSEGAARLRWSMYQRLSQTKKHKAVNTKSEAKKNLAGSTKSKGKQK